MASLFSLLQAAERFISLSLGIKAVEHSALMEAGKIIETEAKRVLGTYDYGWPPLATDTIMRKATGDSPLLETGELRDSIQHMVTGNILYVGSNNPKAMWHEYGTRHNPPRPFLSGAVLHKQHEVSQLIGRYVTDTIIESLAAGRIMSGAGAGAMAAATELRPQTVTGSIGSRLSRIFRRGQ